MIAGPALKRHPEPDPIGGAVAFFGLIAAAGFALGWMTHALGAL